MADQQKQAWSNIFAKRPPPGPADKAAYKKPATSKTAAAPAPAPAAAAGSETDQAADVLTSTDSSSSKSVKYNKDGLFADPQRRTQQYKEIKPKIDKDFPEANAHIYFDEGTAALKCKTCITAGVNNSFTDGCTRITKQAVKEHFQGSSSNSHHAACEKVAGRAGLQSAVEKQQTKVQGAHVPLARTVLWMCICMLPLALIGGLVGLQVANGSTQLAELRGTYCNPHVAKEYAGVFSNMLDDALIADLQKSPWFSVLVDESTDVAIEKHLAVYVRYISPDMRPVERFLQLTELTKSDAATIHAALLEVLEDRGMSMRKLVGFGSDGASVMTGEQTGVGARLKHRNPYIVHTLEKDFAFEANEA